MRDCRSAALVVHRWHRRRWHRGIDSDRSKPCPSGRDRVRRPSPPCARRRAHPRSRAAVAQSLRRRNQRRGGTARPPRLRARVWRSIRLRRRVGSVAAHRSLRNGYRAGAVHLHARRRASGLVCAGDNAAVPPWPIARSDPSASAAGGASGCIDFGQRRTGRPLAAAGRLRVRQLADDRARSFGRSARTRARDDGGAFRSRRGECAQPDAVFIGGGAAIALDAAVRALRPGGWLVVNAVTTETEALLLHRRTTLGGELRRIAISRVEGLGGRETWRPALPVTQWVWV